MLTYADVCCHLLTIWEDGVDEKRGNVQRLVPMGRVSRQEKKLWRSTEKVVRRCSSTVHTGWSGWTFRLVFIHTFPCLPRIIQLINFYSVCCRETSGMTAQSQKQYLCVCQTYADVYWRMLTYAVADVRRGRSPPPPNHSSRDGTSFELVTLVLVAYVTVQPARVFVRKRQ